MEFEKTEKVGEKFCRFMTYKSTAPTELVFLRTFVALQTFRSYGAETF